MQDVLRLQTEIQQLNDIVFSKSFKAPSAWAEREVKYKAEKRDWEQKVGSLKEQINRLSAENQAYRESTKAAEFEAQVKVLTSALGVIHLPHDHAAVQLWLPVVKHESRRKLTSFFPGKVKAE